MTRGLYMPKESLEYYKSKDPVVLGRKLLIEEEELRRRRQRPSKPRWNKRWRPPLSLPSAARNHPWKNSWNPLRPVNEHFDT